MKYKLIGIMSNARWLELQFESEYKNKLQLRVEIDKVSNDWFTHAIRKLQYHMSEGNMYPIGLWLIDIHYGIKKELNENE